MQNVIRKPMGCGHIMAYVDMQRLMDMKLVSVTLQKYTKTK